MEKSSLLYVNEQRLRLRAEILAWING